MMKPFRIEIPEAELEDLKQRITATRWPDEIPDVGWSRGVPLAYLKELAEYWATSYDWRAAEAKLNQFPQFLTEVDGAQVHFLHITSPEPNARPMIMTHGWPGSVVEFLDVIGPLTNPSAHGGDPNQAYHLVIPSMPGYGFSGPTGQEGWGITRIAKAWTELMSQLGYDRYIAQGGDWGAAISLHMAKLAPEHVAGVHLNMYPTIPPPDLDPAVMGQIVSSLDQTDLARLQWAQWFTQDGNGWDRIQSTRPQTLAYGLTDSPVGQLAWIVEKFKEWSDSENAPDEALDRDTMLSIVSIYWFTATAGSSAQLYRDTTHLNADYYGVWGGPWTLEAPVALAVFPKDPAQPIRMMAQQSLPTLTQWTEYDAGGHFAALEKPEQLIEDIRKFGASLSG